MKFQKFLITILIVVCSSVLSFAQNFKGIVYDELRQPIAGATVIAEKAVLISNNKGEFYLNKNPLNSFEYEYLHIAIFVVEMLELQYMIHMYLVIYLHSHTMQYFYINLN